MFFSEQILHVEYLTLQNLSLRCSNQKVLNSSTHTLIDFPDFFLNEEPWDLNKNLSARLEIYS